MYNVDVYRKVCANRVSRRGGGVSLYVKNDVSYIPRDDISIFNDVLETKFIEIDKDRVYADRNVIVGMIYRPPCGHVEDFSAQLGEILEQVRKKVFYLLGDYNIKMYSIVKGMFQPLIILECMFSNEYIPLIKKPRDASN